MKLVVHVLPDCEINVHKQCHERLKEVCRGAKRKKDQHRKSVLEKIQGGITRKPSQPNPAASKSVFPFTNQCDAKLTQIQDVEFSCVNPRFYNMSVVLDLR